MRVSFFLLALTMAIGCIASSSAKAALVFFDLKGVAGNGLLAANEPQPLGTPSTASGGEVGAGIFLDDATNLLTVNVGWGSSQGFNNLTSLANNSHIHGPTASNNGSGFTQTAGVLFNLTRSSDAITGGTFTSAPIALSAAQVTDLMNGKFYINIHTANNGGGELRGFIVAVPEPSSFALLGLASIGAAGFYWKKRNARKIA
jgi:hypothetical protein